MNKKVLLDKSGTGQVEVLEETEALCRFLNLVVAILGAWREVTARVLFDGTNGNNVNTTTHLRDQERSPVAAESQSQ